MSITPDQLLVLAESLVRQSDEASHRSAASRAFLAAYHVCLPVHALLPYAAGGRSGTHAEIIEDLAEFLGDPADFQMRVRILGTLLKQCRVVRVKADYRLASAFFQSDAKVAIADAARIRELAAALLS